jgi:hypothetical protein
MFFLDTEFPRLHGSFERLESTGKVENNAFFFLLVFFSSFQTASSGDKGSVLSVLISPQGLAWC